MRLLGIWNALLISAVLGSPCFAGPLVFQIRMYQFALEQTRELKSRDVEAHALAARELLRVGIPQDAILLWSAEIAVKLDSPFYGATTIGDQTVGIEGSIAEAEDGRFLVSYSVNERRKVPGVESTQRFLSEMILDVGQEIAGLSTVRREIVGFGLIEQGYTARVYTIALRNREVKSRE